MKEKKEFSLFGLPIFYLVGIISSVLFFFLARTSGSALVEIKYLFMGIFILYILLLCAIADSLVNGFNMLYEHLEVLNKSILKIGNLKNKEK